MRTYCRMSSIIDSIWKTLCYEISIKDYIIIISGALLVFVVLKNAEFGSYRFQLALLTFMITLTIRSVTGIAISPYVEIAANKIPFSVYWNAMCCTVFIFFLAEQKREIIARIQFAGLFGAITVITIYLVFFLV